METNSNDNSSLKRLVQEIADLAEHASLTGSLASGESRAVARYNSVLGHLAQAGAVPDGLFSQLDEELTSYGQLGVESRLLASFLDGKSRDERHEEGLLNDSSVLVRLAPFVSGEDLGRLVREQLTNGVDIGTRTLTALAPFLDSSMLSELLRMHFPGVPKPHAPQAPPEPPSRPVPASAQAPAEPATRAVTPYEAPSSDQLADLAARLRQPDISPEERERISLELSELARQQANLSLEAGR